MAVASVAIMAAVVMVLIFGGIGILVYVFESVGLYVLAKRRGIENAWLSWIPIGSSWIIGSLSDQFTYLEQNKKTAFRHILLWGSVAGLLIGLFSGVGTAVSRIFFDVANGQAPSTGTILAAASGTTIASLISMALAVLMFIALYRIYKSCTPNSATVLLVLSIIFPIIIPFTLFALRKRDDGMPQPQPQYGGPQYDGSQYGGPQQ